MIAPLEALRIILQHAQITSYETVPLAKSVGRVLRENIVSDRDQPPFNKCLMDGIGISFDTWQKGQRSFYIQSIIPAGIAPPPLKNPKHCVQIMTGAVIPQGCDCVIPIEQVTIEADNAECKDWTLVKKFQSIRAQGADGKKGKVLLEEGCRLWSPQIGLLASVGKIKVRVSVLPKIAVISTGNELVDIDKPIKHYQTRFSNAYALQALFNQSQLGDAVLFHVRDKPEEMLASIKKIVSDHDIIILSGGVSMGDFDYVPGVLTRLGIKQLFHKVSQKPGKPFWFGVSKSGKPVFALPGNPVSTQICAYRYIIPFLTKASGLPVKQESIPVLDRVNIQSDLTHFLPVVKGRLIPISGSGDFASLAQSDGFIEYDTHKSQNTWPYFSWRV